MKLNELKLTKKRLEVCQRLDLNSVEDILSYYPFRYEEYVFSHFDSWSISQVVTFECELISYPSTFRFGHNRARTSFRVLFEDNELIITIFNRPWINNLHVNDKLVIIGKYDGGNKVTALNYYNKPLNEVLGITPIYPLKDGISQNYLKAIINIALDNCSCIDDLLPKELIEKHHLISYQEAINNIHNPKDRETLSKALSRLKYEEFLRFYVAMSIINGFTQKPLKEPKNIELSKVESFKKLIPYELTIDQNKAIEEIIDDLRSHKIMYRLLQGDVGSGKTVVAMLAIYANYLAGFKSVLMAPTEILAKQHYQELKSYFDQVGVSVALLIGGSSNNEIKHQIKNGQVDVIVGTHALFQDDVEIANLGLVITDEQHRFGVKQRRKLKEKGQDVDFLMMSATPIPRTLASSIYGDMDISTIVSMPKGRKGCKTYLIKKNSVVDILDNIKAKLQEGRQVYIIAAAIEANENYDAKDVYGLFNSLKEALAPFKLGFLHGRMSSPEKDEIMESFNKNDVQVLVSTTVVEVGVNVKNATMMIIYDADRFGLSQLHQLRGRVQRSNYEGTCYLLTRSKEESVMKRLQVLCDSNDGFKISYEDLKLRGPGDILGTRQSGLPSFILGNIVEDGKFVEAAKLDAKVIMNNLDNENYRKYYDNIVSYSITSYGD